MLEQAVILAGGLGTRLGELTRHTPKPLLAVGGVPFLEHIVWGLRRQGITRFLFSVGHLADRVIEHFGDGDGLGSHFAYVVEDRPLGTGGALLLAAPRLEERFLVLNGDTLFDVDVLELDRLADSGGYQATLALRADPSIERYGGVQLDGSVVTGFEEKSGTGEGLINGGVYIIRREALEQLPASPSSLERDMFPALARQRRLGGKLFDGLFIDIGTPSSLAEARRLIPPWRAGAPPGRDTRKPDG